MEEAKQGLDTEPLPLMLMDSGSWEPELARPPSKHPSAQQGTTFLPQTHHTPRFILFVTVTFPLPEVPCKHIHPSRPVADITILSGTPLCSQGPVHIPADPSPPLHTDCPGLSPPLRAQSLC